MRPGHLRTVLGVLGVLALVALAPSPAAARQGRPDARSEHRRITGFWTPERRAAAIPLGVDAAVPKRGKPGGGPGGGDTGTSTSVIGATWTGGGDVTRITGKVFFQEGQWLYTCSGSVVDSTFGSLVLTAGHCVHDGDGGAFHDNWIFYPGYQGGAGQLGGWTATDLFTTSAWADTRNAFAEDLGLAAVVGDAPGTTLEQALTGTTIPTVAFDLGTTQSAYDVDYTSFGYPAAKKYKGDKLVYCQGPVRLGLDGEATLAMACDMTGGSSGGPWYRSFDNGRTMVVNSLNSYGYNSLNGYMFGPVFGSAERTTYNGASGSGDCPAAPSGYRCIDLAD